MTGMPRPRAVSRSPEPVVTNAELARIFSEIADMLEISGELVYKSVAYRRVAGALRGLKGLSARTEESILAGMARLADRELRLLLHDADRLASGLVGQLRDVHGVRQIEPAGSLRRREATIGDLDLLAATDDPAALIAAFGALSEVGRVLSAGTDKSSVLLASGTQADLMVCAPAAWGSHLVHFTGSRAHNAALRGMALGLGVPLSEKGFTVLDSGALLPAASERDIYERLGLPWIAPEVREDAGG